MEIELMGYRLCNLWVGGDGRDRSIQRFVETSPEQLFLVEKTGDIYKVYAAKEIVKEEKPKNIEPISAKPKKKNK